MDVSRSATRPTEGGRNVLPNLSSNLNSVELTPPYLPPRSLLYHLEPQGIGTPYTEGLSGYIARLAQEHFVTPRILMFRAIIPNSEGQYTMYHDGQLINAGRAINSLGTTAASLVGLLEKATLRKDLKFTTMLTWENVLPTKGLIRPARAWCSPCYQEWADADQIVYEPLIWSLAPIKVCVKHGLPLSEHCHLCGRSNHHLDTTLKPGHCSRCKQWLGTALVQASHPDLIFKGADMKWQYWIVEMIGELISSAPSLLSIPQRSNIAIAISKLVDTNSYGRVSEFARLVDINTRTVHQWLNGRQLPKITTLLSLCRELGLRLKELLCQEIPNTPNSTRIHSSPVQEHARPTGIMWVNWDMAEIQLNTALEEYPPPSFALIARGIGCDCNVIRRRFPELSAKISSRFLEYKNWSFDPVEAEKVLKAALEEIPPPSITEIIRRLGVKCSHKRLRKHFPTEYRQIVDRYLAIRKKPFDEEGTRAKLLAALEENPPRSLSSVAKSLGIRQSWLHKKLPDLHKAISAKYRVYRIEEMARKKNILEEEVFRIGKELHSKGIYPSRYRILQLLRANAGSYFIREAHRKLKIHLDLD